jgi:O-methyltransferase
MEINTLLNRYPIISNQVSRYELTILLQELNAVIQSQIDGDVVEFGCYEGTAALFEARVLQQIAPRKQLWLYDSFEGLPEKSNRDISPVGEQFIGGALRAKRSVLINHFKQAGLPMPNVKKAWFEDLLPQDLPEAICFAFLDGDYYDSVMQSLRLVWPKLSPGAIVVVDDYQNEALPGAAKAVDEWLSTHPASIKVEASLAIIRV